MIKIKNKELKKPIFQGGMGVGVSLSGLAGGLGKYPLAKRLPDRIYIGNQFCPCLFPTDEQLFRMLEKAERDGLSDRKSVV